MSRTLIIIATIAVVVVAVTVWIAIRPADEFGQAEAPAPAPQRFDTTSGQEMKPRWSAPEDQRDGQGNGGADGAADN